MVWAITLKPLFERFQGSLEEKCKADSPADETVSNTEFIKNFLKWKKG